MPTPELTEEEQWIADERLKVAEYLEIQGCRHAGIAEWPVFFIEPYVALWAIQSTKHVGRTGWWAISGDVPTDYMSSSLGEHPRDALRHFAKEWADVADHMRRGKEHPTLDLGSPDEWPAMAEMLEKRSEVLLECADDDETWAE